MTIETQTQKRPITPLWIIALFISLTQTVVGIAVIQTTGAVQVALTIFVIVFPLLVAGAFFVILWNRPYVLYPPTEYGRDIDVSSFVQAMQQRSLSETKLYSNINDTIRSTLTSDEVIDELSQALSPQIGKTEKAQFSQILDSAAEKAIENIREGSFLLIDSRPILGDSRGKVWEIIYREDYPVWSLLTDIWSSLGGRVPAYTYGKYWALRDSDTGDILLQNFFGTSLKRADDDRYNSFMLLLQYRTVRDVGIRPGMRLEVIDL